MPSRVIRPSRLAFAALTWIVFGAATPVFSQGIHRFHQGNSLTGPLINDSDRSGGVIHALAVNAGFPDDSQWMIKNAGIPIDAIFNKRHNPTMVDDMKRIVRENAPIDVVVVQPYGHQNTRRPEDEANAAAFIYREALKYSPKAKLFVYYNWVSYDAAVECDATVVWRERTLESHKTHFDPIVDLLRQEFPGKPVYCLPVGQAMVTLSDLIEGGKLPGLQSTVELFDIPTKTGERRTVHPHARGYYLSGLVHFFSYYHALLKSLPGEAGYEPLRHDLTVGMPYSGPPNTIVNVTDEQAAIFQRVACETLRRAPRTILTDPECKQPTPGKTDFDAPTAPANLRVAENDTGIITIAWDASTDAGAGLRRYVVYLDGIDQGATIETTYRFEGLASSGKHTIDVRALDNQYNYSTASIGVNVR